MRSLMMLVVVGLAVFTLALGRQSTPVSDPGGSQPGAPTSVLSATTRMVALDVVATDEHGNPFTDLKAGDSTVLDKGHQQDIKAFEFSRPAQVPTGESVAPAAWKLPANVFSNSQFTRGPKTTPAVSVEGHNHPNWNVKGGLCL